MSLASVSQALASEPPHGQIPFDERCNRIFSAHSFLFKHRAELEKAGLIYLEDGVAHMSSGLIFSTHLFFQSGNFILPKEPQLELFILAAHQRQKEEMGEGHSQRG